MKLASLADRNRDGTLVVVRSDHEAYVDAFDHAPSLSALVDDWLGAATDLRQIAQRVELGATPTLDLDITRTLAPLPRIHGWIDGAQGEPGELLGYDATLPLPADTVASVRPELCLVLGAIPRAAQQPGDAYVRVLLLALAVDVEHVGAVPGAPPSGRYVRPATAFAPFAVSTEAIDPFIEDDALRLDATLSRNGEVVSRFDLGEGLSMRETVDTVRRHRAIQPGTVVATGAMVTPSVAFEPGDVVELEAVGGGRSVFGTVRLTRG